MNKNFKSFEQAKEYAKEMRNKGFKSYIEEFYDYDGKFYTVLVWQE